MKLDMFDWIFIAAFVYVLYSKINMMQQKKQAGRVIYRSDAKLVKKWEIIAGGVFGAFFLTGILIYQNFSLTNIIAPIILIYDAFDRFEVLDKGVADMNTFRKWSDIVSYNWDVNHLTIKTRKEKIKFGLATELIEWEIPEECKPEIDRILANNVEQSVEETEVADEES